MILKRNQKKMGCTNSAPTKNTTAGAETKTTTFQQNVAAAVDKTQKDTVTVVQNTVNNLVQSHVVTTVSPPPAAAAAATTVAAAPSKKQGTLNLGEILPNFEADTTQGKIKLHEYFGTSWGVLFSHPADFTPVCTTELNLVLQFLPEFTKRNCKVIALSCDPVDSHVAWSKDVLAYNDATKEAEFTYPIIADSNREIAIKLGMLDAVSKDAAGLPLTARAVFICAPDKTLKLSILYPATTGRNFTELIRVIDSLQLTAQRKLATPADWEHGQECVVSTAVSQEDAPKLFPAGVRVVDLPSKKPYLRFTAEPTDAPPATTTAAVAAAAPTSPVIPRLAGLNLGDELPNFEADTTQGKIKFHDFLGKSWGILFSHPYVIVLCSYK